MQRIRLNICLAAALLAARIAPAATISSVLQENIVEYVQTGAAQPDPSSALFGFEGIILMQNPGDFSAGNVALPGGLQPSNGTNGGANPDMHLFLPTEFVYLTPLLSQAAYSAEFPNGIYTYTATGSPSDTVTINQAATPPFPSSVPFITNYTSLQGMNPASPFTVTSDSFAGALPTICTAGPTTCSFSSVALNIFHNGVCVFCTINLPASTTSIDIPANTFAPNTEYLFRLFFFNDQTTSAVSGTTLNPPEFFTFAFTSGTFTTGPEVPEPSSLILTLLGLGIVAAYRRHSKAPNSLRRIYEKT